ncbi:hypothetical protein CF326_g8064 [Tilletia indica]|nr:hypothetical protein CF326_g8064 [Tilletia indica]
MNEFNSDSSLTSSDDESNIPAARKPPDSRRRLKDADIDAFFDFLRQQNLTCSNLLRTLFDPDTERFGDDVRKKLRLHVKPFFRTQSAFQFVKKSTGARQVALEVIRSVVDKEAQSVGGMPEIRRQKDVSRADDIRTFRLRDASRTIQDKMPFTYAIVQTIVGAGGQSASDVAAGRSAVAEATAALPSIPAATDETEEATAEEDLMEPWEDEDAEEPGPNEAGKKEKQAAPRKRGHRSPLMVSSELIKCQGSRLLHANIPAIQIAMTGVLFLLFGRNRANARLPLSIGLFLFASRTGRRVVEVLSRMGLTVSYLTLLRTVKDLASASKRQAQNALRDTKKAFVFGYDNINWLQKTRNTGPTTFNSMSAAVHGALYEIDATVQLKTGDKHPVCDPQVFSDALGADMPKPTMNPSNVLSDLVASSSSGNPWPALRAERDRLRRAPIPPDIHPTDILIGDGDDDHMFHTFLSHARKAFLTQHPYLDFASECPEPPQVWPLTPRRTNIITLPILDVDEGTVQGNMEVFRQYFQTHLKLPDSYWRERVNPIVADGYTVGKLRTAQRTRQPERSTQQFDHFSSLQAWAAPWHLMYAYIRCIFINHGGSPDSQYRFNIRTLSERVGFRHLLSQPHSFHDASRFLQLWFSAASCSIISSAIRKHVIEERTPAAPQASTRDFVDIAEEFKGKLDKQTFLNISAEAIREVLSTGATQLLMKKERAGVKRDDYCLHARTMYSDVGLLIEMQSAISSGDPGRMVVCMKQMAPRFQATGQHNYVSEILETLVLLRYESSPPLRAMMLSSLLVNTKGGSDTFMPIDLCQENYVFDLKHTWPVGGTVKSIAYKSTMGSLLQILCDLKMGFWHDLGISAQGQKHSDKKRSIGIKALQRDLDQSACFDWDPAGRRTDSFEVLKGEALRRKREEAQAAGRSLKSLRQLKNISSDIYASGFIVLQGSVKQTGSFFQWYRRRAVALGKEGMGNAQARLDDAEDGGEDASGAFMEAEEGQTSFFELADNQDGFEELADDDGNA